MRLKNINQFFLALLYFSCAQQSVPSGGEKDSEPPKLIQSIPGNRQTDFSGNQITLVFDEFVQLNNPREQLIITPEIDVKKTEITARKNKVILRLNQRLQDSTTYTINFRETIQDLTERNPTLNLKIAFSTGPSIDTMKLKGRVVRLLTDEPESNCLVGLAPASDTFDIFRHKPKYFSLTDKQGVYEIDNVKAGIYILYAFQDKNKNLIVDSKSEMFGFKSKPLELTDKNINAELGILKLDMRPLKLVSARPVGKHFIIRLNKGLLNQQLINTKSESEVIYDIPENGVIRVYPVAELTDSIPIKCNFTDSINQTIDTLLYARFSQQRIPQDKFNVNIEDVSYYNLKVTGKLTFNKPVLIFNPDSAFIPQDSLTSIKLNTEHFKWNFNKTSCQIEVSLSTALDFNQKQKNTIQPMTRAARVANQDKETNPYRLINHLVFRKGTFISVEKDTASEIVSRITELREQDKAILLYEVITEHNVITELYQKDNTIMVGYNKIGKFININPGEYKLRCLIDKNGNNKWDWGNFYLKEEPEPIVHYQENDTKNIPLKANWELGPLLIQPKQNVED